MHDEPRAGAATAAADGSRFSKRARLVLAGKSRTSRRSSCCTRSRFSCMTRITSFTSTGACSGCQQS